MPVIRKNARWLLPAFVFMICALIFFASTPGRAVLASGTTRQLPIYSVQKDDKVVALTIDAVRQYNAWLQQNPQYDYRIFQKHRHGRFPTGKCDHDLRFLRSALAGD